MSDELLVQFEPGVSRSQVEALNELYGAQILEYIPELNVYVLKLPASLSLNEALEAYQSDPRVVHAEPNFVGTGGDFFPNDPFFPAQWYLHNEGQTGGTLDADIDAVEGWQITRGDSAVVVAVLDSGINADSPEFRGRLLPGFDFVNEDGDPEADHPHGVYVTGVLAANTDNGVSVAGVDHNVSILPVKVLNQLNRGTVDDLIQGLIFAANEEVDVINMSLINYPSTFLLNTALQFARDAGAILVACAGNQGIGNADQSAPGVSPLTISVGATDDEDARANFSGTGRALDLVAPGVDLATVPFSAPSPPSSPSFDFFSGCSAATPVVSGIVTLLLSLEPGLTQEEVLSILAETAEDLVGPASEDTPGRDDFYGFGRVNLNDALLATVGGPLDDADVSVATRDTRDPVRSGTRFSYIIEVHNVGSMETQDVVVTDILPRGVRFIFTRGTGWRCDRTRQVVMCTFSEALGADEATPPLRISVRARVRRGLLTNVAEVGSLTFDPNLANNRDVERTRVRRR